MKKTKKLCSIMSALLVLSMSVNSVAVSYTHLDVYKRQGVGCHRDGRHQIRR